MSVFINKTRFVMSGLLMACVCVGLFLSVGQADNKSQKKNNKQITTTEPVLVNAIKVSTAPMPKAVSSLGTLEAIRHVTISSETDGKVSNIYFKNGDQVTKGMPIAQIDNQQEQAAYQKAVTVLKLDQQKYARYLAAGDAISAQDLATQKAQVEQDKADVQSKQADLNQKEITAPFTGVLGTFKISQGDYVSSGDAIVDLVDTSQLQADYSLSEDLLPQLKKNQIVKVTSTAYPNKVFYGTVNYISPSIDQDTRTISVQALLPNSLGDLSPGMFVHISQQIAVNKQALVIPLQAAQADIKGYFVYKIVNGHSVQTPVNLGTRTNTVVQVISGLQLGDEVVSAGAQKLNDGDAVRVIPASGVPDATPSSTASNSSVPATNATTPAASTTGSSSSSAVPSAPSINNNATS